MGASDGDLSVGALIAAIAELMEVDAAALRADLLPRVRELALHRVPRLRLTAPLGGPRRRGVHNSSKTVPAGLFWPVSAAFPAKSEEFCTADPGAALGRLEPMLNMADGLARLDALTQVPVVAKLGRAFAEAGHELAIVGGPVRDALLGRQTNDLDFTTDALPDQILRIVKPISTAQWDIGRAFGTIGARIDGEQVEVTTYRADSYDGVTRKPTVEFGDTLDADLVRRDFTVNAMALRVPGRTLVDPTGGVEDLLAGVLRTPADPAISFGDDPLRMLRAARFSSQLGFDVDPTTVEAMAALRETIAIVSPERIQGELVRLLQTDDPVRGIRLLVDTGLMAQFLPEIPALRLEVDEHHHHKDVYEHSLTVLRQAIELEQERNPGAAPDVPLRLAALLHDIGKPATRKLEPGGAVTFHHHDVKGSRMARKRLQALRFDSDTTASVDAAHRAAPALLRLRRRGVDGFGGAAVRAGCRTRARAPAHPHPGRRHNAQQAQGLAPRPCLRRHRGADRGPARAGGAGRDAPRARRQPHPGDPGHPRRPRGGRGLPLPARPPPRRGPHRPGRRGAAPARVVGRPGVSRPAAAPPAPAWHPARLHRAHETACDTLSLVPPVRSRGALTLAPTLEPHIPTPIGARVSSPWSQRRDVSPETSRLLIERAHEELVSGNTADQRLLDVRPLVRDSWRRSLASLVGAEGVPPLELTAGELEAYRRAHPLAGVMDMVRALLLPGDAEESGVVVAIGDAAGRLLWVEGDRHVRTLTGDMGFVAGANWSETAVGTSAPGTAIALDRSVQIHGAEHFNRLVAAVVVHGRAGARPRDAPDRSG